MSRLDEATSNVNMVTALSSRGFLSQVGHYAVATLLPAITALASSAIFTRMFSPGDYGVYILVNTLITFIASLLGQLLQQPVNRYLPQAKSQRDRTVLLKGIVVVLGVFTVLVPLLAIIARPLMTDTILLYFLPAAMFLWFQVVSAVLGTILQAEFQSKAYARLQALSAVFKLGIAFLLAVTLLHSPVAILWGAVAGVAVILPLLFWRSGIGSVILHPMPTGTPISATMRRIFAYGLPMVGYFLSSNILGISDRYVISGLIGNNAVGIYAANYGIVNGAIGLLTAPILVAAHPFLMAAWARRDEKETARWLGEIGSNVLALGIILIGGTYLLAPDLARLFLGEEFRQGWLVMPIAVAGMVAMAFANYAHKPFEFRERNVWMTVFASISAGLNIGLNIWLVPHFGYIAAAWTTFICFTLYALVVYILGKRLVAWKLPFALSLETLGATTIAVFIAKSLLNLSLFIEMSALLRILTGGCLLCLIAGLPLLYHHRIRLRQFLRRQHVLKSAWGERRS